MAVSKLQVPVTPKDKGSVSRIRKISIAKFYITFDVEVLYLAGKIVNDGPVLGFILKIHIDGMSLSVELSVKISPIGIKASCFHYIIAFCVVEGDVITEFQLDIVFLQEVFAITIFFCILLPFVQRMDIDVDGICLGVGAGRQRQTLQQKHQTR